MRRRWATRDIAAPVDRVWSLLVDVDGWPRWGPSVRRGAVDAGDLEMGSRGTVTTALGLRLPFEITAFRPGRAWSWTVAGWPATDHELEPLGVGATRVRFGVPAIAWPYLAVCRVALRRIDRLATAAVTP